jgi:hypothetical protein
VLRTQRHRRRRRCEARARSQGKHFSLRYRLAIESAQGHQSPEPRKRSCGSVWRFRTARVSTLRRSKALCVGRARAQRLQPIVAEQQAGVGHLGRAIPPAALDRLCVRALPLSRPSARSTPELVNLSEFIVVEPLAGARPRNQLTSDMLSCEPRADTTLRLAAGLGSSCSGHGAGGGALKNAQLELEGAQRGGACQ